MQTSAGAELATELNIQHLVVETDCVGVWGKLQQEDSDISIYGPLVMEIKEKMQNFQKVTCSVIRRSANGVAHVLAKAGCNEHLYVSWFSVAPGFIEPLIEKDCTVLSSD